MRMIAIAALAGMLALPATAHEFGPAGLMDRTNRTELPPLTLASGKPLAEETYQLKSGGYYTIEITSDGSAELAIAGPEFFRAIWINEVVINDIEIRPLGVASLEFDDEGTAKISFVAITPGSYTVMIPGTTGESQRASFVIK
ncbi:hypothetical protein V8J36_02540 [Frigidibacter sp. MR17.14]|uniref:hypothetical protein n=1 Tax=Frigidibacter sp. MR17.14 TaxID=3126509 RepID=UPI003012CD3F